MVDDRYFVTPEDIDWTEKEFVDVLDTIEEVNWREMTLILLTTEELEQED